MLFKSYHIVIFFLFAFVLFKSNTRILSEKSVNDEPIGTDVMKLLFRLVRMLINLDAILRAGKKSTIYHIKIMMKIT